MTWQFIIFEPKVGTFRWTFWSADFLKRNRRDIKFVPTLKFTKCFFYIFTNFPLKMKNHSSSMRNLMFVSWYVEGKPPDTSWGVHKDNGKIPSTVHALMSAWLLMLIYTLPQTICVTTTKLPFNWCKLVNVACTNVK